MSPATAPGIRHLEPSVAIISVTGVHPAIAFCFFLFFCNIFLGLGAFCVCLIGLTTAFP
jgi:hypothetical protein